MRHWLGLAPVTVAERYFYGRFTDRIALFAAITDDLLVSRSSRCWTRSR